MTNIRTTDKRINKIINAVDQVGISEAGEMFGIDESTVKRYIRLAKYKSRDGARVLVFDIETAPIVAYVWKLWKENIGLDQIKNNWFCLSWSAKWLYSKKIMSDRLTGEEARAENDKRIIETIRELLDEADIVIAHNGDRFDIVKLNSRFLFWDLKPVSPFRSIDTLTVSRRQFGFPSNRLDYIARLLGIGKKIKTDFRLWINCMNGDEKALKEMERYNRMDVDILEKVYLRIRGFIKNHPNIGLYMDSEDSVCANCGSKNIVEKGEYITQVSRFDTYYCEDCGGISRSRKTNVDRSKREDLLVSVVR